MGPESSYEIQNLIHLKKNKKAFPRQYLNKQGRASCACAAPLCPQSELRARRAALTSWMALVTHDSEPPGSTWARARSAEMGADRPVS